MFKEYFVTMFGSEKSYLFARMQLAIVLSIIFSVLYAISGDYLFPQIIPAALLLACLTELYRDHRKDFLPYASIFIALFAVIVAAPLLFDNVSLGSSPIESLKYVVYAVFAVLAIMIFLRAFSAKKTVQGKVLLADKSLAIVEVDFDLLKGVKAGRYAVENNGAKKGDSVRVLIKRGLFRGPHPHKIMGKRA
jgi:uncharacterized membrane protein